jgi:photosystem II stability/assembly factor-like uncharacterized protein
VASGVGPLPFAISTDDGIQWQQLAIPTGGAIFTATCPTASTCIAIVINVTNKSLYSLQTTDDGASFTSSLINSNIVNITSFPQIYCFTSVQCVLAAGHPEAFNSIYLTSDFGKTWQPISLPLGLHSLDKLSCSGTLDCLASGNSEMATTTNGGLTWNQVNGPSSDNINASFQCFTGNLCDSIEPGKSATNESGTWQQSLMSGNLYGYANENSQSEVCGSVSDCVYFISTSANPSYSNNLPADYPILYYSTDGGATWNVSEAPTSIGVQDVSCSTLNVCVLFGSDLSSNIVIMRSLNGGQSWSIVNASFLNLFGQNITSLNTYLSCGSLCLLTNGTYSYVSTNNGLTWNPISLLTNLSSYNAIYCDQHNLCWISGSNDSTNPPTVEIYQINLQSSLPIISSPEVIPFGANTTDTINQLSCNGPTCVASSSNYRDMFSNFGSNTWQQITLPVNAFPIGVCGKNILCVLSATNNLELSSDDGTTWQSLPPVPSLGNMGTMSCPSLSFCASITQNDLLKSNDAGNTWQITPLPTGSSFMFAVSCPQNNSCIAVGQNSAISTVDGGNTWTTNTLPQNINMLNSVSCLTNLECLSVGTSIDGSAVVLQTNNFGNDWTTLQLPATISQVYSLTCLYNSDNCIMSAIESDGTPAIVYGSPNNLQLASIPSSMSIADAITCTNQLNCVAGTKNYSNTSSGDPFVQIYYSTDGGATWNLSTIPSGSTSIAVPVCTSLNVCSIPQVALQTTSQGIQYGSLYSADSGQTWSFIPSPNSSSNNSYINPEQSIANLLMPGNFGTCIAGTFICYEVSGIQGQLQIDSTLTTPSSPISVYSAAANSGSIVSINQSQVSTQGGYSYYLVQAYNSTESYPVDSSYVIPYENPIGDISTVFLSDLTNGVTEDIRVATGNNTGVGSFTYDNQTVTPSFNPPTSITGVYPNSGPLTGNTPVYIFGNLPSAQQVFFGSTQASDQTTPISYGL